MENKRHSAASQRAKRKRQLQKSFENRVERLEDRVLLAVDFVPASLGSLHTNRSDQALGLAAPSTEPAIALNQNNPSIIAIANGDVLTKRRTLAALSVSSETSTPLTVPI